MWYIELSRGVSPTALCEALLKLIDDKKSQFTRLFIGYIKRNKELVGKITERESMIDFFLLNEQCKEIAPMNRKKVFELADDMSSILDTILSLSGQKQVDVYDVIIYLALLLLMEKLDMKKKIKILFPRIGTGSQDIVFHILKGLNLILDPLAPVITPVCAAFLAYYTDLFVHVIQGILTSFIKVSDPLKKDNYIQLYECTDWNRDGNPDGYDYDMVGVLETNIDDCTPEVISGVMSDILASGALDYIIIPAMMKKGRTGFYVQVLCQRNDMERIADELLKQTSSFGLRMQILLRKKLRREIRTIQSSYGEVRVKLGFKGNQIIKATPEFDDLKRISGIRGISLFSLYNEISGEIKKVVDCFNKDDKITRF
ncbi:MAG: DUF111 family protein [Spirochaetales bacterium]|nr:DUF111 family protein [Spirochaetales bacterium]